MRFIKSVANQPVVNDMKFCIDYQWRHAGWKTGKKQRYPHQLAAEGVAVLKKSVSQQRFERGLERDYITDYRIQPVRSSLLPRLL